MDVRYKLIGTTGRFTGYEFSIGPGIHQVGRQSSNQIVLDGDGSVSRTHARLTVTSVGVTVEDMKSTNGTYVNGQKVTRQPVKEGDQVRFGDAGFTLQRAANLETGVRLPCPELGCTGRISPAGACTVCSRRPRTCPRCKALNTSDSLFCRADGVPLAPEEAQSSQPALSASGARGAEARGPGSRTISTRLGDAATDDLRKGLLPVDPKSRIPDPKSVEPPRTQEYPRCPQCSYNVGTQAELCPRCHCRVRRCSAGHISRATAQICVRCGRPLLPAPERWGVFRGAGSNGWTPEAVRPPLQLAWKYRPPEGEVKWTSPILGGGVVYAGASDSLLYAMRRGVSLWRAALDGPLRTDAVPETCVPAYSDGRVYIGHMGGSLAAFEAASGERAWQTDLQGLPSSPIRPARDFLYVGITINPEEGAVCALDLEGKEAWRSATDSPVYACPAYCSGSILVTTAAGSVLALEAATGRRLWEHVEKADEFDTSCAVTRDAVYVTSHAGKLLCLDPRTGEVLRTWLSPTGNFAHSSPAAGSGSTEGQVFFGADDRNIYVVSAQTAKTIAAHPTGGVVLGSPAISDSITYVGSLDGALYAIGPEPHRMEAVYRMPNGIHIASSPAVGDGLVLFAGSDGYLYALESCAGSVRG